jgi:hypothetical protein
MAIETILEYVHLYFLGMVIYISLKSFSFGFFERHWEWEFRELIFYPIHTLIFIFEKLGFIVVFLINKLL